MKIRRDFLIEFETHKFVAEASTLGFPIGRWPETIDVVDQRIGNGMEFSISAMNESFVDYRQQFGCVTIRILND